MMATLHLLTFISLAFLIGLSVAQAPSRRPPPARKPPATKAAPAENYDDDGTTDQCPEPFGFFADAEQCDKYYECNDGAITEKLCPDGMVFNDFSPDQEKCDLPFNIDCTQRPKLQTPRPNLHCPRLHGYFGHEDMGVCDKFYYCVDGKFNMITCPAGLVFNPKTGICTWPDEAHKVGCSSEDVFQFSCPKVNESIAQTHPRYADPDDCQYFYVCINGEVPRRNGCKIGQVFDDTQKRCEWVRKVPECADWYKDRLTDAQLDELENPKQASTRAPGSVPSRRKKPVRKQSKQVEETE